MVLTLAQIQGVSALEIDDIKPYDELKKEYTLKNNWGLGEEIARLKLNTPQNFKVGAGYQKVAEIKITDGKNDYNVFNGIELYNIKDGMKSIIREVDYKYKTIIDVEDYKTTCNERIINNGSGNFLEEYDCLKELIGSHQEERWIDFSKNKLIEDEVITIGLFTNVQVGDHVEWIINVYGNERLTAWAEWTQELNAGLVSYWKLNETFVDEVGGNDLTNTGTTNVTGIIGAGRNFSAGQHLSDSSFQDLPLGAEDRTFCEWVYATTSVGDPFMFGYGGTDEEVYLQLLSTNKIRMLADNTPNTFCDSDTTMPLNTWQFICMVQDSGTQRLYQNGTELCTTSGTITTTTSTFYIGTHVANPTEVWKGRIDEAGLWNRTLTPTEITQLYNNGIGITYKDNFNALAVTLNSPVDGLNTTSQNISFNCSAIDETAVLNLTLIIDGVDNQTVTGSSTSLELSTIENLIEGDHTWTCRASDGTGVGDPITANDRKLTIHLTPANVTIIEPNETFNTLKNLQNLTISWNINENVTNLTAHIKNCSFSYNEITTQVNPPDCLVKNESSFIYIAGINKITFSATEEFNFITSETRSWTSSFIENDIIFNLTTQETSKQSFILNLTTNLTVLSITSNLVYNGTNHASTALCEGIFCLLLNTIDIPLINGGESANKTFFWDFTIFNGTDSINIQTSLIQQNVSKIHLEECNATYPLETLNFTTYNEINLTKFNNFQFDGTFNFWIGSGTIKSNNSFTKNSTEINLCLQPNVTMKIDASINYDEVTTTQFVDRFYYFNEFPISNISQEIKMYLLPSASSTSFILKVQDENLLPVSNALIEIHRFYPGEGIFRIVQIAKTDDNGKSIGFFQTEIVDYKFIIKKNGVTLLETGQQKVVPETSPFTLTFNTGTDLGEPWKSQKEIPNLNSSLVWDSDSSMVIYTYIDSSSNFSQARLLVQKTSLSNSSAYTIICNDTSSLSSASINCVVGNTTGFYIAEAFITRSGESLDLLITFQIEDFSSVVGILGLFFGFFVILISGFMFKFNEVAGIWSMTITIFLVNIIGLIKFGGVFVTAIIAIAIILTWVMER